MKTNYYIKGLAILLSFFLLSCGPVLKVLGGLKDPKVYSQEEIKNKISRLPKASNVIDTQLNPDLDQEEIKAFLFMSIPFTIYIYNSDNKLLCYNGETSCSIDELMEIQNSSIEEKYVL